MISTIKWPLISLATIALVACGGTSNQDGSRRGAAGTEGRITINGGLAGATIFVDMNDSGSHDDDEPIGYTDSQGFFGYNPITRVNYCRSDNPVHRQHCLRLPSLDNLPDEVTVFYYGGVDIVTGEQNDKVYRYHVQVDALRGRDLDLDGALAMISAVADSDEGSLDILYGIIDAFYQYHIEDVQPSMLFPSARQLSANSLSAQAKFDELVAQGIFQGMDNGTELDETMSRSEIASILAKILGQEPSSPSQGSFPDIDTPQWLAGYIADIKASTLTGIPGGPFDPNESLSIEEFAILLVKTLGIEPQPDNDISMWANQYLVAAQELGLMPNLDYTSAATRGQLIEAALLVKKQMVPELDPKPDHQLSRAAQKLIKELNNNEDLNDSYTSSDIDILLEILVDLAEDAHSNGQHINLARLMAFLLDTDRDMDNVLLDDFLLDTDFFDATITALSSHIIAIHYDDPVKGNGRAQFRLTPASGDNPLDGGALQACVDYEQLSDVALYVGGQWNRLNDNALLLSLNLQQGAPYTRVLHLDWEQVDAGNLQSIGFDLTDSLEAWDIALLPVVSEWLSLGNHPQADNASCALLLGDD
ncbi:MAG: hypothetical protein LAT61_11145 [Alcanivorax sp.]|nr:hypothetical protein [Alcanivorax sp.]